MAIGVESVNQNPLLVTRTRQLFLAGKRFIHVDSNPARGYLIRRSDSRPPNRK